MCLKLLMLGEITEIVNGSIRSVNGPKHSSCPPLHSRWVLMKLYNRVIANFSEGYAVQSGGKQASR